MLKNTHRSTPLFSPSRLRSLQICSMSLNAMTVTKTEIAAWYQQCQATDCYGGHVRCGIFPIRSTRWTVHQSALPVGVGLSYPKRHPAQRQTVTGGKRVSTCASKTASFRVDEFVFSLVPVSPVRWSQVMNGDSSFAFASILAYMPRAEDDPREGFRKTSFYACVQYIRRHVPTRPLFLSFRFFVSLLVRGFISSFLFHSLSPFLVSLSLSLSLFLSLSLSFSLFLFSLSLSLSLSFVLLILFMKLLLLLVLRFVLASWLLLAGYADDGVRSAISLEAHHMIW